MPINGTSAGGVTGPNLTHVASRLSLAAGPCPTRADISPAGSSTRSCGKPGNNMPPNLLMPDDLQALLSYLETLQ